MKESDIRPQSLFNRYLEISRKDIVRFFSDRSSFVEVPCPACASEGYGFGLEKFGFRYVTCSACGSLYLSPRPTREMINAYYCESESVKFWGTDFFRQTAEARRERIFRPRAQMVEEWVERHGDTLKSEVIVDVGSGYGIFLEEVRTLGVFREVVGIEPAPNLADICERKGFRVIRKRAEEVTPDEVQASFATAFEVIEHLYDPEEFMKAIARVLIPGGVFVFTTLTVSGFDVQVLWEHSKSVYPPHHINLISVEGARRLLERIGLEIDEVDTPGELDVDIVVNTIMEKKDIKLPRFIEQIVKHPHEEVRVNFQQFLKANRLSSHLRGVARRPAGS